MIPLTKWTQEVVTISHHYCPEREETNYEWICLCLRLQISTSKRIIVNSE